MGSHSGRRFTKRSSSEFSWNSPHSGPNNLLAINFLRHLKPGVGHLEQVEIDLRPRCDNGEVPARLLEWYEWLEDATARGGKPIQYERATVDLLRQQGFVDIRDRVIRLPFNAWPQNLHERDIGRWYSLGLCEGLEALSLGPFTRVYQWPADHIGRLCEEVKGLICNRKHRVYNDL